MANTSKLSSEERKQAKRKARAELKTTYRKLTKKQLDEFGKKKRGGVKGFILGTNEETD